MPSGKKYILAFAGILAGVYLVWLSLSLMQTFPESPLMSWPVGFGILTVATVFAALGLSKRRAQKSKPAHQQFVPTRSAPPRTKSTVYDVAPRNPAANPVAAPAAPKAPVPPPPGPPQEESSAFTNEALSNDVLSIDLSMDMGTFTGGTFTGGGFTGSAWDDEEDEPSVWSSAQGEHHTPHPRRLHTIDPMTPAPSAMQKERATFSAGLLSNQDQHPDSISGVAFSGGQLARHRGSSPTSDFPVTNLPGAASLRPPTPTAHNTPLPPPFTPRQKRPTPRKTGLSAALQDLSISSNALFTTQAPTRDTHSDVPYIPSTDDPPLLGNRRRPTHPSRHTLPIPGQFARPDNHDEEVAQVIAQFQNRNEDTETPSDKTERARSASYSTASSDRQDLKARLEALRSRLTPPNQAAAPENAQPPQDAPIGIAQRRAGKLFQNAQQDIRKRSSRARPGITEQQAHTPIPGAPLPNPVPRNFNAFDVPTRRADNFYQLAVKTHAENVDTPTLAKQEPAAPSATTATTATAPAPPAAPRKPRRISYNKEPFTEGVGSMTAAESNKLWQQFVEAHIRCKRNPAKLRPEVFRSHLQKNHEKICAKLKCTRVSFSVKIKAGKPALSAKPIS